MNAGIADIDIALVALILLAAIAIVAIWQVFANQRANAAAAQDDRYQALAEQAAEALEETAADLTDLKQRVTEIEELLKEVE